MNQEKKVRNRVIAAVLIVFGLMLAITWWDSNATKFPDGIGNYIFTTLGLPVWSKEASGYPIGTHYPTVVGGVFMWVGCIVLERTMNEKQKRWLVIAIIAIFVIALILK